MLHRTVQALDGLSSRWVATVQDAGKVGCCAWIWPAPKQLVQAIQSDEYDISNLFVHATERETTGVHRSSRRGVRDSADDAEQIQDRLPAGATASRLANDMARERAVAEAEAARVQEAKQAVAQAKDEAAKAAEQKRNDEAAAAKAAKQKRDDEAAALKKRQELAEMQKRIDQTKKLHQTMQEEIQLMQEAEIQLTAEAHQAHAEQSQHEARRSEDLVAEVHRIRQQLARLQQVYEAASAQSLPASPQQSSHHDLPSPVPEQQPNVPAARAQVQQPPRREQDRDEPEPEIERHTERERQREPEISRQPKVVPRCANLRTGASGCNRRPLM